VVIVELTIELVLIGAIFLLGLGIGIRVEEHFLESRERQLAQARRALIETARVRR